MLQEDLDGGDASETVRFAIDGTAYEIDLNNKNAKKLRQSLASFVEAGRKVGRSGLSTGARRPGLVAATIDREQNKAIRAWAKKTGKDISDRGRVPQTIVDEYHAKAGRKAS